VITIVNGYMCFSSCEAAKARAGEDPHKAARQIQNELNKHERAAAEKFGAAVVFGGSLQASADAADAQAASTQSFGSTSADAVASSVDLLV
jgi:hypothetical protein